MNIQEMIDQHGEWNSITINKEEVIVIYWFIKCHGWVVIKFYWWAAHGPGTS